MPKADYSCNSIIFNGNILISRNWNRNLLLFSIDIDSFSTIPYEFAIKKVKILIKAERLHLIECGFGGSIYECESGSCTNWRRIGEPKISIYPSLVYCSYNKGGIYIGSIYQYATCYGDREPKSIYEWYRFDLNTISTGELLTSIYRV